MILKTLKSTSLALLTVLAESMFLPYPEKMLELIQITLNSVIRKIPGISGRREDYQV